ncbi:hypothetical protein MCHI_001432, partial [Candidatus Magnetoovum chiemensis]
MRSGFRYNMEHIGDIFVNMIDKTMKGLKVSTKATVDLAKISAKGVVITHDIHDAKRQKKKIVKRLGLKVAELGQRGQSLDLSQNEEVISMLNDINELDNKRTNLINERKQRLHKKERTWFAKCKDKC